MFEGKVIIYKRLPDGREEKIEKVFDNPRDYEKFVRENNLDYWRLNWPNFLWDFANFHNYLKDLVSTTVDNYLENNYLWYDDEWEYFEEYDELENKLDKYEQALEQIEYNKQHKEERIEYLENTKKKLEKYKKTFEKEWKSDLVKEIEEDLKKVNDELKKLKK